MRIELAALFLLVATAMPGCGGPSPAATGFNFNGKPIHPGCISEFAVALSDPGPPIVKTIDLQSALDSNKNFDPPKMLPNGYLECTRGDEWFDYKYLGTTPSGTDVLLTQEGGGRGSMVAMDVYLIRRARENYFEYHEGSEKPAIRQRWVLKCIGQIVRGDRDDGVVTLHGQTLTLGKSRYREAPEIYQVP